MTPRQCNQCGTMFQPKSWRDAACSEECRRKNRAAATERWRQTHREQELAYRKAYVRRPEVKERNRISSRKRHHQRRDAGVLEGTLIPNDKYLMLDRLQGGTCAICRRPETSRDPSGRTKRLAVDHDHETGLVRGLLCHACNIAIGLMADDPQRLEEGARYLRRAQKKHESWQRKVAAVARLSEAMA